MQQVAQQNGVALISPANTTPDLTQGKDWKQNKRVRQFSTYFRTATTDEVQRLRRPVRLGEGEVQDAT